MKKLLCLTSIALMAATTASAEYLYGFGGVYLDHQSWTHGVAPITGADGNVNADGRDQFVIGVEGGAGFSWGELYGFYDYENISKGSDQRKASLKGTTHIYLGDTGVSAYAQIYNHVNPNQSEQNRVLGLGYTNLKGDGWFFKPWIGVHEISNFDSFAPSGLQNINGANGFMAGWTAMYSWNLFDEKFSFVNWNEIEFSRNDEYAAVQGGDSSIQGAAIFFWNMTDNFKMGVQYRYFNNKLGIWGQSGNTQHYGDALIYRIQYDF